MREVSMREYLSSVVDYEKLCLIKCYKGEVILLADIECGGEYQQPRIEMMNFELDKNLTFSKAIVECREHYAGGISFIENDDDIIDEFIKYKKSDLYIKCAGIELRLISEKYPNMLIHIMFE